MGKIETSYDLSRDLTLVKATGNMTADDFHDWTSHYYAGAGPITSRIVWDFTDADLSEITPQDIQDHALRSNDLARQKREGGRTAIVVDENLLAMGLGRMREIYGELKDAPIDIETFSDTDEALRWLGIRDT